MSKLELLLLGHFEGLLPSGKPLSLSMRKAEVLLAYLALAPGIRHPRERLINLLWSDRSEEQARNSLRQCLSAIRKSLGDSADLVLQIDRSSVTLNPELIEVDCLEFERLATDAGFESWSNAAELYRGEFLEGITIRDSACQDWLEAERARFKRQYIEILHNHGHTHLASREFNHAIRSAERLVEQDPLSESGWRLLMRARHENGDRSHALQAFKRCQQVLRNELDVDPEADTITLRDMIANGTTNDAATVAVAPTATKSPAARSGDDHSIAVLPFDNLSGDPEQEYFSDGITDSIILNLSCFPGLQVKSRNSSFAFKEQIKSVGEICDVLNVDYIVEGSVRRSQNRIRITVQLIESGAGNQIWGKRYDADLSDLFDLEEELSRSIAATVTGQIESDLQRIAIAKSAADQHAYDLLLAGNYHIMKFTREDTVLAIDNLNQCLAQDPDNIRAHALLYAGHAMDYLDRWTEDYQASFKLAETHIHRALELGPETVIVQTFYAEYLSLLGEFDQAIRQLDKVLAINPNDPDAFATRAVCRNGKGEFESALQDAERAIQLDPYHSWAQWEQASALYLMGRYEEALDTVQKFRTDPGFSRIFACLSYIKLGRIDHARQALQAYLQTCREDMLSMPQTRDEWLQYTLEVYKFTDSRRNRELIDGLVQAGLEEELAPVPPSATYERLPTVLVLPFDNLSGNQEQDYFSDGITESVILNLGSFSGLRVKSRHASFAFKNSARSIEDIAAELDVDYVVEGSIRKYADKVRITVQLGDAQKDNQLWGRRFDSELENLLDLEQELSRTIAGTVIGRIDRDTRQVALRKPAKDLRSYDYFMRGCYHIEHFTARDIGIAIELFEKCLKLDPDNAQALASLGMAHIIVAVENISEDRSLGLDTAHRCLARALDLDPDDAASHAYMAEYQMYCKNFDLAQTHAHKSIELNPTLADGYSILAWHAGATRQYDQAIEYAQRSMQIDQFHPYVGWNAGEVYRVTGNYLQAIETFRSMAHMSPSVHAQIAACFAALGRSDEANTEMRQFLELAQEQMHRLPANEHEWRRYWEETMPYLEPADLNRFFELLLEAGLCDQKIGHDEAMPSIAVLPFENMSGDPEQEFFSDGITADIIATLSKFKHLRIVARHSTEIYRERKASIAEIAAEQGVRYILEGSVRKNAGEIRVSAELVDVHSETNIWSEHYDRKLDDVFAVQDDITRNITVALKMKLTDGERSAGRAAGTRNVKAWELILLATDLQDSYIQQNVLDARKMIQQALKLDPKYAYAYVGLGWTHWQEAYSGWTDSFEQSMQSATATVEKALQLEPDFAEAWILASTIHILNHEPDKLATACKRALELEPGNAEVQALAGFAMNFIGDYEKATEHFNKALTLCPFCPNWYYLVGAQPHRDLGNLDKAEELLRRGITAEPDSPLCRFYLADLLLEQGNETGAQEIAAEIRKLDQSMNGRGLARAHSNDAGIRDRFLHNLEKLGLA